MQVILNIRIQVNPKTVLFVKKKKEEEDFYAHQALGSPYE